ncbi:thiamine pyrophosphate-binding protein [Bengtsoniella intestinalis]|uniref:thiamine pyrophosphate-binding protein n=1 Tax=Bengtsoniella intestinalis TaxID=3073143 RepID=UPI00391F1CF9
MKVYQWIEACLQAYGCRQVFGVPGALVMPVWQNLNGLKLTLCGHEGEASYVATGYGKKARELVAVVTTGGPGVTNCVSGIAAANLDSIPLLYISGRTPIGKSETGLRQEEGTLDRNYDSSSLLRSVTKSSVVVTDLEHAPWQIEQACLLAVAGRGGSTHLSIPVDLQDKELDELHQGALNLEALFARGKAATTVDKEAYPQVELVRKPTLIVMGWGCWMAGAVDDVYGLAHRMGAPVVTTSKGVCCVKKDVAFLGKLGYGDNPVLEDFIREYAPEQVLAFGTSMSEKDISSTLRKTLEGAEIHVFTQNAKASQHHGTQWNWHETRDLKGFIRHLRTCVPLHNAQELWEANAQCDMAQKVHFYAHMTQTDTMAKAISGLNPLLREGVTITADAGNHLLNTATLLTPEEHGATLMIDDGIRAMGSGICQTVGMAMADRHRPYIAITGDGCMLMNGNILHLVAREQLPVLFVVMDNGAMGRVRVGQMNTGHIIASDLGGIDFTLYGKSFGVDAHQTDTLKGFETHVKTFLADPKPTVLVLHTDPDEIPIMLKAKGVWN